jgi:hypothetical protein
MNEVLRQITPEEIKPKKEVPLAPEINKTQAAAEESIRKALEHYRGRDTHCC